MGLWAQGLRGAQDRGRLIVVQLRVAQGGILIDAGYSVLAQRPKCRAAGGWLLVSYGTLARRALALAQNNTYAQRT